jgi:hypothetical protein
MNRYNRSLLLAFLLLFWAGISLAQPNISRDTTHYNDEELYDGDVSGSSPGYSWIGGGLIVGMHLPSLSNFNSQIAMPFIKQNLKERAFMIGGQGFIPVPWVKNLRIGGIGMSGNSNVCCVPFTASNGQPTMRSLTYHVGYGALTLDYSIVNTNKFHILAGMEIGFGSVEIIMQQAYSRPFDVSSEFDQPSNNITHNNHAGMFILKPQVEFEYAPFKMVMVRLAGGYQLTSMGTWQSDDAVPFTDEGALTKVNGNGPVFHLGIFLGFF